MVVVFTLTYFDAAGTCTLGAFQNSIFVIPPVRKHKSVDIYMTMLKVMLTGHQSHIWGCSCHSYTNTSALDDNTGLHWSPLLQMGSVRLLALHSSSVM